MVLKARRQRAGWFEFVERVGFPAAVAFYVLFSLSSDVRELIQVERAQTSMLSRLVELQMAVEDPTPRPARRVFSLGGDGGLTVR